MSNFVLHFPKPDEPDKKVKVLKVNEKLADVFWQADITSFEYYSEMPYLQQLYQLKNTTRYEILTIMRKAIVEILHFNCGMSTFMFASRDDDEIFCKVFTDDDVLLQYAHRTQYPLRLSASLQDNPELTQYMPMMPFDLEKADLFQEYENGVLTDNDKLRLTEGLIRKHMNLERLMKYRLIIDVFPVPDEEIVQKLEENLLSYSFSTKINIEGIRGYFGEKVAFYFLWTKEYTDKLYSLGIIGVMVWGLQQTIYENDKNGLSTYEFVELLFACIVCIWACMFIIHWNKVSNLHSFKWGVQKTEEQEFERQEFQGLPTKNEITGRMEKSFPQRIRAKRQVVSYITTFFLAGVVIVIALTIFFYKATLIKAQDQGWGTMICAILNALNIYGMNWVYDKLSVKLNSWENYRTDQEYDNALIIKKVAYQFINYYISLFYIAFLKKYQEGCDGGDCMAELNYNLWVMFALNMIFNVLEIGLPIYSMKSQLAAEEKHIKQLIKEGKTCREDMSLTEIQGKLEKIELLHEYLELVMNFGYIIFFSTAFPLGPIIYWIYNLLEIKADSYKFLKLSKRPIPRFSKSIGVWNDIMGFFAVISIITNIGLIIFTRNSFELSDSYAWGVFVVIEHALLLIVILLLNYYPIEGAYLRDVKKWQEMFVSINYFKSVNAAGREISIGKRYPVVYDAEFEDSSQLEQYSL